MPKAGGFPSLGAHGVIYLTLICMHVFHEISHDCSIIPLQPFQPSPAPVPTPLAGWMSNPPAVAGGAIGLSAPTNPGSMWIILASDRRKLWKATVCIIILLC